MITASPTLARPTAAQHAWQELELGMFVHFGPATFQLGDYDALNTSLDAMRLDGFDADDWCRVALSLGARYLLLVAKHTGGFCWWPTSTTTYSVASIPWKKGQGDLVGDVAAACRRHGLKLGMYLSPQDEHLDVALGGKARKLEFQAAYAQIFRTQLEELLSRYGELCELWFDGSLAFDVRDLCQRYQPNAVHFQGAGASIRWSGNEDGVAPLNCWNGVRASDAATGVSTAGACNPDGEAWLPIEADFSVRRPHWFWRATNQHTLMSPGEIINTWYTSIGRGAQMVCGVCPDSSGAIPPEDAMAVAVAGRELRRRFADPLVDGSALDIAVGQRCDHVLIHEDLREGERVRGWELDVQKDGAWNLLSKGNALGRKRVITFDAQHVDRLRLRITDQRGEPRITRLAVFNTGIGRVPMPEERPGAHWYRLLTYTPAEVRALHHRFELELSTYCTVAGQWQFALQPGGMRIHRASLTIDGAPAEAFLRIGDGGPNIAVVNVTGISTTSTRLVLEIMPADIDHLESLGWALSVDLRRTG